MKIIDVHHDLTVDRLARSREVLAALSCIGSRFDAAAAVVREVAPEELAELPPVPVLDIADWEQACHALVALDAFLAGAEARLAAVREGGRVVVPWQVRLSFVCGLDTIARAWRDAYLPGAHYVISPELPVRPDLRATAAWASSAGGAIACARRWSKVVTVSNFRELSDEADAAAGHPHNQ
ncbi:hypothetical protein ACFWXO_39610 [Kitasatospora sp. NPDC059088]|uniref:hypothetical protein n=1 Tax=Kitasatospora sp. NPDC059088 TaxID=3346722 RepID=UPI0036B8C323